MPRLGSYIAQPQGLGTEAVLQLNALLFNLIAAFKDEVLRDANPTLGTLRHTLFVLGGLLRSSVRRSRLFLGVLADKTRYRLASLLERLDALIPTVAQFVPPPPPPMEKTPHLTPGCLPLLPPGSSLNCGVSAEPLARPRFVSMFRQPYERRILAP